MLRTVEVPAAVKARARDLGIVIFLVMLFLVLSVSTSTFLQQDNLLNVLDQSSELFVLTRKRPEGWPV